MMERALGIAAIAAGMAILLLAAGSLYERLSQARDAKRNPAPGRLVPVGGHRLHLLCKGSIGPTVLIEQGAGEPSVFWWPLQDKVSEFARVCTYDRAGYGWSDPPRSPQTIQQRAEDLHALLANAQLPVPYILVAHSYGSLIVRWFAQKYRDQVAGLVLVDTAEEGVVFRKDVLDLYARIAMFPRAMAFAARFGLPRLLRRFFPSLREQLWFVKPSQYAATADDLASLARVTPPLTEPGGFGSLEGLPLVVLTHGQPFPGPFALLEKYWAEGQKRLAALSEKGELVVAQHSNHMIHLDQPDLVINAIRQVHAAARNAAPLDRPADS
jgi:pimeloyl-ACP methyl ester carboxylesterase